LIAAGADIAIGSVAELIPALQSVIRAEPPRPGRGLPRLEIS
jgi:hypothetical protein